jgi:NTE family protein
VLERIGLVPDCLAGTSVGGCIAAMYAAGSTIEECAALLDRGGSLLLRPTFPSRSLLSSRSFRRFLRGLGPNVRFEDLELPLALVTADLTTGLEVVLRRGIVWQAVLATMSIPGIFPAQRIGPYTLVDGGIVNPVPTSACEQMGARTVIGVKLVAPPGEAVWGGESVVASGRPPFSIAVILRAIELMQSRIEGKPTETNRITITPSYPEVGPAKLRQFRKGRRFIENGEEAAEAALPRIKHALPWLNG